MVYDSADYFHNRLFLLCELVRVADAWSKVRIRITFRYIFSFINRYTLVPGILMPTSGYVISYIVAKLARQRWREARTIAVGASLQNAGDDFVLLPVQVLFLGIAFVICQLSLEPPDSDIVIVMPVCCLISTSVPLWLCLLGRTIAKKKFGAYFQIGKETKNNRRLD